MWMPVWMSDPNGLVASPWRHDGNLWCRPLHHMLTATGDHPSNTVAGLEANTLADGLFHAAAWIFVIVGMTLAVRAWQRGEIAPPWRVHIGMLLTGWGLFNLVEGVVDHHLLTLHHVRDDVEDPLWWDLGFLAFGALLVVIGLMLARPWRGRAQPVGVPR